MLGNFDRNHVVWQIHKKGELTPLLRQFNMLSKKLARLGESQVHRLPFELRRSWVVAQRTEREEIDRQKNLLRAYRWINAQEELNLGQLQRVHAKLTGSRLQSPWRHADVKLRSAAGKTIHHYAAPSQLPFLLDDLQQWSVLNQRAPLIRAIGLQFLLCSLHCFSDANGRVARAFEAKGLQQAGHRMPWPWHPEVVVHLNPGGYNKAFQQARRTKALDPFLRFMLEAYVGWGEALLHQKTQR